MLGPGTYTRSLHYTHERRRPSPFSPGRDSALSALSRSLLDWTNCTILVVVCQRQFRAAARMRLQFHFLFIYWMLRAKRRKKKEEKRGKVFGYLFELGPLSIFLIIRRRRRRRKRFLYIGLLLLLPRVDLMPSFPAAYREKRGQQSHFL